jgi:hypothetical protein
LDQGFALLVLIGTGLCTSWLITTSTLNSFARLATTSCNLTLLALVLHLNDFGAVGKFVEAVV